jgi:hypothetical protein
VMYWLLVWSFSACRLLLDTGVGGGGFGAY